MAQLVFSSISGGSVTLNGPNTATTYNLAVPAANGTLLYQDLSGSITFNNVTITGLLSLTGTGAFKLPVGNTAQRPTPVAGDIRYNTDGGGLYEVYFPAIGQWYKIVTAPEGQYTITYLVVGGGGGAYDVGSSGIWNSGGAGGAQVLAGTLSAVPTTSFVISIGGGGAVGATGSSSSITGVATAVGGFANPQAATNASGGASGSGFSGGTGVGDGGGGIGQGGGGGAGAGANGQSAAFSDPYFVAGQGGVGVESYITGTSQFFGGGGGGGSYNAPQPGGNGGGGAGSTASGSSGNGTVNSGGAGGGHYGNGGGGSGGSGVVYLSIPTASYTGTYTGSPTVTTVGSNTVLKFTGSGSYTA
jgi:hypothetical protein